MKKRLGMAPWLLPLALLGAGEAFAAGGHHTVDDATILPRGECEQESWFTRLHGGDRLLHAGFNCGIGPVELGIAGEHARADLDGTATAWNAEVKWAREIGAGFSVGLDLQPLWQPRQRPRFAATRVIGLATWAPGEQFAVHLNLGREFVHRDTDVPRYGLGLDWSPLPHLTFTGERFAQSRTQQLLVGARWEQEGKWKIDISRTNRLAGPVASGWTIGLTLEFGEK